MTSDLPTCLSPLDPPETSQHSALPEPATGEIDRYLSLLDCDETQARAVDRFRHSGWSSYRNRVNLALHRTGQTLNRCLAFEGCGFGAYILRSQSRPYQYRLAGTACKDRFCMPCSRERSRVISANALELLQGKMVRFVTLTIRTDDIPLKDALAKLDSSFRRLRARVFWQGHVNGGVAFTEVIWSKSGHRWHPHLHVLTHGRYMTLRVLKQEWLECTGDSTGVDIRLVKTDKGVLNYVTKYCGKGVNTTYVHDDALLDEAIRTLKGRRLLTAFGDFRGSKLTDTSDGDTWDNIGGLWEYLQRARDGDVEALTVLDQVDSAATNYVVGWLRLREPLPLSPTLPPTEQQHLLFGALTWFA